MKKLILFFSAVLAAISMISQPGITQPPPPPASEMDMENMVLTHVQEMPKYPGGEVAMYSDISQNAIYPEAELEKRISGRVYVSFIVEKDGSVSNVRAVRTVQGGPGFTPVAINAIKKL